MNIETLIGNVPLWGSGID